MEEIQEALSTVLVRYRSIVSGCALAFACALFFLFAPHAHAATLYIAPGNGTYQVGQTFTAGIYVTSTDAAINAYSGMVWFPRDLIEVTGISKTGITSLWVAEPAYSNAEGFIAFEGIVLNPGFTGSGGTILTVTFKTKASGVIPVRFTDSAVLANDGLGTNVLTGVGNASYTVGTTAEPPAPAPTPTPTGVPGAPTISSSTHPDQNAWYAVSDARFSWSMPAGVTGVNVLADHSPTTDPGTSSDGVFSTYEYKGVEDGIWYMHVKLRNDKGWGATSHFRFAIDTVAPGSFVITLPDGEEAVTAHPRIEFFAEDALSGIDHYVVTVNGSDVATIRAEDHPEGTIYELPTQTAGEKNITVTAFDKAGNTEEATLTLTVTLPVMPTFAPELSLLALILLVAAILLLALIVYALVILRHWSALMPGFFSRRENRTFLFRRLVKTRAVLARHGLKLERGMGRKRLLPTEKKIGLRVSKVLHDLESDLGEEIDRLST